MNAPMDPLRHGLAELAQQVRPVDLRDRVLRTSRRIAVRRAMMTSTAVVAVLGVVSGVAFAMLPQRGAVPPPPTGATPAVSPDRSQSASPSPSPSAPATVVSARILPGQLFYQSFLPPPQVYTWDGGTLRKVMQTDDLVSSTPRISPDGSHFAWVSGKEELYVANADGSGVRKVRDNVAYECVLPAWTADSQRLLVGQPRRPGGVMEGYDLGYVEMNSGQFKPIAAVKGCHFTLSPGGVYLAYPDGSAGKVWVARADGTDSRVVPVLGDDDPQVNPQRIRSFDIHSLSPDGNLLVCRLLTGEQANGDVALHPYANAVIDTRTGRQVTMPVKGELINAVFLADGSLLARLKGPARNELVLISSNLKKVLDRIDEPAELKDRPLMAYIPA
jgi:hypothetical protein